MLRGKMLDLGNHWEGIVSYVMLSLSTGYCTGRTLVKCVKMVLLQGTQRVVTGFRLGDNVCIFFLTSLRLIKLSAISQ